jgi:glycosyltransferase involved in cell wall biosynthesis
VKIIVESLSYPPNVSGVAVFVKTLVDFLLERGHEVILVIPAKNLKTTKEQAGNKLTIYRLRSVPNPVRPGFHLPIFTRFLVRKIIKEEAPHIIHVNDPMALSRYLQREGIIHGIATVATSHFSLEYVTAYVPVVFHRIIRAYVRQWIIRFYNRCEAVVAPSQSAAGVLGKLGVKSKLVALSNGVNLDRFYAHYPSGVIRARWLLPKRKLILYVGRLDKDKAVDVLFGAMAETVRHYPCHLVLVGTGNQKFVSKYLERFSLKGYVTQVGPIPHDSEELVGLYQAADIFVMPSSIETQSISTMEAAAAGRAIVAANAGALPELIIHNKTGLLFDSGNPKSLAEQLLVLLRDGTLRSRLGQAAQFKIVRHEQAHALGLYIKLYEELS